MTKEKKKSLMKKCREREYRRTFPEARKMAAKQGCCPTKPASRGNSALQLNVNEQLSNGPMNAASRGKSASQINANEQLSNGATKVRREKERFRTERERAAAKRTHETSQEKELRLRARRERAALKRQSKSPLEGVGPNRRAQSRRDSDNRRRNQRDAIFAARRSEYLHNRGWADPENLGLHHEEWAQEEMAAFHRFD